MKDDKILGMELDYMINLGMREISGVNQEREPMGFSQMINYSVKIIINDDTIELHSYNYNDLESKAQRIMKSYELNSVEVK